MQKMLDFIGQNKAEIPVDHPITNSHSYFISVTNVDLSSFPV